MIRMSEARQCSSASTAGAQFENEYSHDHVEFVDGGSPMKAANTCSFCAY